MTFRTFGSDHANFVYEFNKFCSGDHPAYNGRNGAPLCKWDGSEGCKDLRVLDSHQHGVMYRTSPALTDAVLVTGHHVRGPVSDLAAVDATEAKVITDPLEIF